jgi:hypothetical protein
MSNLKNNNNTNNNNLNINMNKNNSINNTKITNIYSFTNHKN